MATHWTQCQWSAAARYWVLLTIGRPSVQCSSARRHDIPLHQLQRSHNPVAPSGKALLPHFLKLPGEVRATPALNEQLQTQQQQMMVDNLVAAAAAEKRQQQLAASGAAASATAIDKAAAHEPIQHPMRIPIGELVKGLQDICRLVWKTANMDDWDASVVCTLADNSTQHVVCGFGRHAIPTRELYHSVCRHNYQPGQILTIPDTVSDPRSRMSDYVLNGDLKSYVGVRSERCTLLSLCALWVNTPGDTAAINRMRETLAMVGKPAMDKTLDDLIKQFSGVLTLD